MELEFHNVGKCFHDITNKSIANGKTKFRSFTHKIYTFKNNGIANRNPNENENILIEQQHIFMNQVLHS